MLKRVSCLQIYFSLILFELFPLFTLGQVTGIKFESGLSWNQILTKAKTENKYIFLDCYTTWCGPCKWMSKHIFPDKEVADFFNAHFINVGVQMDKTAKDSQVVIDWYRDAAAIGETYGINAYPTFLFFAPDGHVVHQVVGSTKDAKDFIVDGEDALNPDKQYYTTIKRWKEHEKDSAYLLNSLKNALTLSDTANANAIGSAYMKCIQGRLEKDNVPLIAQLIRLNHSSSNMWFKYFVNNATEINATLKDTTFVQWVLGWDIIANEEIAPYFNNNSYPINWNSVASNLRVKYPTLGEGFITLMSYQFRNFIVQNVRQHSNDHQGVSFKWGNVEKLIRRRIQGFDLHQILLEEEARYYSVGGQWVKCGKATFFLMRKYGDTLGQNKINNISWDYVFEHCNDKRILMEAVKWMKHYIDLDPNRQQNTDTYANLLYKIGNRKEAIVWERKAIALAEASKEYPQDIIDFKTALAKMESGTPTWQADNTSIQN